MRRKTGGGAAAELGLVGLLAGILACSAELPGQSVPEAFQGDWVPVEASCDAAARLRVSGDALVLINDADEESYGSLRMPAAYFGPSYTGIAVVVLPTVDEDHPFTVTFNADEQADIARVDIHFEIANPANDQVRAIQDASRKLAERFPIDHLALRRCPG